ncbi:hypothetical protein ABII15_36055 [Streptomyces sp. HUAS MG91]|uniref:Transcriptional regulator n=1 Tax=Streptomyces tabacisoli TaxID=3156398 RepID=A0AAU8J3N8_9ACTN
MRDDEKTAYNEAVDDAVAGSLGRTRMADGRRVELSVEELAMAVGVKKSPSRWDEGMDDPATQGPVQR